MLLALSLNFAAIALGFAAIIENMNRTTDIPVRQAHWITVLFGLIAAGLIAAWGMAP